MTELGERHGAAGPSSAGSVVLDIGAGTGALVLFAPADLDGAEIEVSVGADPVAKRTHSQVRKRGCVGSAAPGGRADIGPEGGPAIGPGSGEVSVPDNGRLSGPASGPGNGQLSGSASGSVCYAAVYPGLAAATYTIWRDAHTPAGTAEICGGQVTTWHWPTARS